MTTPTFRKAEMNNANVPADVPGIISITNDPEKMGRVKLADGSYADAPIQVIVGGKKAPMTIEGFRHWIATKAIKAEFTVRYLPKAIEGEEGSPMDYRNQSVNRILRRSVTGLTMEGGRYSKGGAEPVLRITTDKAVIDVRLDQMVSLFYGEFVKVWPLAPDITPETGRARETQLPEILRSLEFQVGANFIMNVSTPAQSDGHMVPGTLIPMWTLGQQIQPRKTFLADEEVTIGQTTDDAEGNTWRFLNVRLSPANSPVYSTAYILNHAGVYVTRQVNAYNKRVLGFVPVRVMVAQVFGQKMADELQLPEIAEKPGTFTFFSPTKEGIEKLQARRNGAVAHHEQEEGLVEEGDVDEAELAAYAELPF